MVNVKKVKIELGEHATCPVYGTPHSAGMDMYTVDDVQYQIAPGETALLSTQVVMEIPEGYYGAINSRSGMARKGIVVAQGQATIDSDYRGEIMILVRNEGNATFVIPPATRIAQMILIPYAKADFEIVDKVTNNTERGAGGFGSTGTR